MEPYERSVLSDAFVEESFKAGDRVIILGEEGNKFYLVEEGELAATKTLGDHEEEKEVMHYKAGDYFGELALLKNQPRAANVVAKTDCLLVAIDRHSFKRMMGPLESIMKRRLDVYDSFQEHKASKDL